MELAEKTTRNPQMPALIFSDAGDNPGGGGSGNTTWLVKSLIDAGIPKVFYGSFFDPELAAEAHRLGENAEFSAQFNRQGETEFSKVFLPKPGCLNCPTVLTSAGWEWVKEG